MYRCSQCGNLETLDHDELYKTCQISNGESCDACKHLEVLNTQIFKAKKVLEDLLYQRRELKSRVNSRHDIFIRYQIPEEIVASVFEFYVEQLKRTNMPGEQQHELKRPSKLGEQSSSSLILGTICRTWRRIAWSTPGLWTSPTIGLSSVKVEKRIELFLEWLGRSGELPLSITVHNHPYKDFRGASFLNPLIKAINRCSGRWYSLDLNLPYSLLSRLSDSKCESSILHDLNLRSHYLFIDNLGIINAAPTNVTIGSGLPLTSLRFKWTNLTRISAHIHHADEIVELLGRASQVIYCDFKVHSAGTNARREPIIHPQLKYLNMEIECRSTDRLLDNVRLPSLKKLACNCLSEVPTEALVSLLARSSCVLEELSLRWHHKLVTGEEVIQLARAAPSLAKLSLLPNITGDPSPLDSFYRALSCHLPTVGDQAATELLLPLLETFTLDGVPTFPWDLVPGFFTPFNEMENAHRRPLVDINVNCMYYGIDYIDRGTLSRLQSLMEKGVSLKYRCCGVDLTRRLHQKVN